jgi:hypothetical protein
MERVTERKIPVHLQPADVLFRDSPKLHLSRVLVEQRAFEGELRDEPEVERELPRWRRINVRQNSKPGVFPPSAGHNSGKRDHPGAKLTGDAGCQLGTQVPLIPGAVQVLLVTISAPRKWLIFENLNLKWILRARNDTNTQ